MTDERFTPFWSGPFSQWLHCEFEVDGVQYNCTEQYMMAEKARLFNDAEMERSIMEADHPRDQKYFGRMVEGFEANRWNEVARDIVYKGNYAKFTQNPGLRAELEATIGTTLVEASPHDKIWGVGLGAEDDAVHDRDRWQGTNWLGEVLTKVRDDLLAGVETTEDFGWSWVEW